MDIVIGSNLYYDKYVDFLEQKELEDSEENERLFQAMKSDKFNFIN